MQWRGASRRILAYGESVDMRKGVRGLLGVTRSELGEDALNGDVFIFINRRSTVLKALWWDRTGWCVLSKRLERARFELRSENKKQELSEREFEFLLDGILRKLPNTSPIKAGCTITAG